jgi:hypothetical protein
MLAATQKRGFCRIRSELDWGKRGYLMRSIAIWLMGGKTAGAPEVAFPLSQFDLVRPLLRNLRCVRHLAFLCGWLCTDQVQSLATRQAV